MIWQTCKMSWAAVCANKLRTFLTMLGIIIGVSALIVLVSIADGASSSVSEQISDMGSSYLTVRVTDDKENPIRLNEFQELMDDEALEAAAPYGRTSVTAKSGYTSGTMSITGTTGSYFDIMNLELSQIEPLAKDVTRKFKKSQESFSDINREESEFLQKFAFICMLSFDVYVKKQVIEQLIDHMSDPTN